MADAPGVVQMGRRPTDSVRARLTGGAVAVVGLALLVGSVALVVVLRESLTENVRAAAELKADEVAALIRAGSTATEAVAAAPTDPDEQFVQVLDVGGSSLPRFLAASRYAPPLAPPLLHPRPRP